MIIFLALIRPPRSTAPVPSTPTLPRPPRSSQFRRTSRSSSLRLTREMNGSLPGEWQSQSNSEAMFPRPTSRRRRALPARRASTATPSTRFVPHLIPLPAQQRALCRIATAALGFCCWIKFDLITGADSRRLGFLDRAPFPQIEGPPQATYVDPAELSAERRDKSKADSIETWVVSVRSVGPLTVKPDGFADYTSS